jgi:CHASE2 domain-containing sensor protein
MHFLLILIIAGWGFLLGAIVERRRSGPYTDDVQYAILTSIGLMTTITLSYFI